MKKSLLELLKVGGVGLLSLRHMHEGGSDLCRNHPRLQIGDFIFSCLRTQYSLPSKTPLGW
jgi:hypothetical protein